MKVAYRGNPPSQRFLEGLERLVEAEQTQRPVDTVVESVHGEDELTEDPSTVHEDPRG